MSNANKFHVKQSTLTALSLLAAQNDIRYYLNGLLIEWNSQTTRTVACDGHKLGVHATEVPEITIDAEYNLGRGSVIVPHDALAKLPKLTARLDPVVTFTRPEPEAKPHAWVMTVSGIDIGFTAIEGNYPDWRRVVMGLVNKGTSGEANGYRLEYLQQFEKCGNILAGGKKLKAENRIVIYQNGTDAALIRIQGDDRNEFAGVIMPLRNASGGAGARFPSDLATSNT
jgi:hypothetical protein